MRQKAMILFGVTEQTVFNAIGFKYGRCDTATAKRIRSYILKNGGIIMNESPEVETLHDAEGKIRQYYPNGAVMEIDKQTGNLDIFYNGEKLVSFEDVRIWQLDLLQHFASNLVPTDAGAFSDPGFKARWLRGIQECWKNHRVHMEHLEHQKHKEY